jgi:chromosome segregation ATPase
MASTLDSLQRNLMRFNEEFNKNLTGLSGIFDSMRSAIREQKDLLDALDRAKVSDMTRYNVAVLKQLDVSVKQFERFNEHITNVNRFVESSATLVSRSNEILDRTDNFREIADGIKDRLQESRMLMEFLSAHFNNLESHKDHTNQAVVDVALAITDVFSQLKRHIEAASQEMKTFTVDELQILKDAFSQSRNNLGNLEHLSGLKADVAKWKETAAQQAEAVKKALDQMNGTMAKSKEILEKLESRSLAGRARGLKDSVARLFGPKK